MIVKVIIKRDIIKGKEKNFFNLLKNIRVSAMHQKGYLSGETLIGVENPNKVLIISQWESLEDWNRWKDDIKRREVDVRLSELQENPTIYESYVFSKYRAAAKQGFPPPLQKMDA